MATTKATKKTLQDVTIQNAELIYLNFSGSARTFNPKGVRNFHVVLPTDFAKKFIQDGWNVRLHEPKEDGDLPWYSLKVRVRFDNFPPRVVLITSRGQNIMTEHTIDLLDSAKIKTVDLIITPYSWSTKEGQGITAYLKKMFVTLDEGDLEAKYFTAKLDDED